MRISDLRALGLLSALPFLGACVPVVGGGGTGGAPAQAVVTADRVVIAGPPGFCVDEGATRAEADTAFVLLGNCAAISGSRRADQPETPVVLTAAVSDASDAGSIAESLGELDGYFRSDEGRALLSRTQEPGTVTVLETDALADMFILHASDTSAGAVEGVVPDYWRAYFDLGPRIATLSVLAMEGEGVTREDSLAALMDFVASVQAANGVPVGEEPAAAPEPRGGLFNIGRFRQIMD
ncbi:MAG: hypothetical protein ACOCTP_05345 [Roseicyclus sp.]